MGRDDDGMKKYTVTLEAILKDEENVDSRLYNLLEAILPYLNETNWLLSDSLEQVTE